MANVMEIMQLCRLCLVKDQVNIPIFEEQGDIRQIFLKISACLPVKVSQEDNLPKKICDGCSYKLEMLYQFWNTSANSEKQLLKWLSQVGIDKVPTSDKTATTQPQSHSLNTDGVILKQEVIDLGETHADEIPTDDLNVPTDPDYLLQQQSYQSFDEFQQDGFNEGEAATSSTAGPSSTVTSETVAQAPKRKRRAAAMKPLPPQIDSEDEDDDGLVETKIAKNEEEEFSGVMPESIIVKEETTSSLPSKSKKLYEKAYVDFMQWCNGKGVTNYTENVLLSHFLEMSEVYKASSLCSYYSKIKSTLLINRNVDISKFSKLNTFLKQKSRGYQPKQSKILSSEQMLTFIMEAPDDNYLMIKVAVIMGIAGALRCRELLLLSLDDIQDEGSTLFVKVKDTKANGYRFFRILNSRFIQLYKKYASLRPPHTHHRRFFIYYKYGKCSTQAVGKNTLGKIPATIAAYLKLPDPDLYTGHCLRRSSAISLAKSGLKCYGDLKSRNVEEFM